MYQIRYLRQTKLTGNVWLKIARELIKINKLYITA